MRISALLAVFLLTTAPALAQELRFSARTADCAAPTPFPNCIGGSFVDQGTTAGANDTVDQVNIGCFGVTSVPGPDVIYSFNSIVAFGSPTIDIRVTPALGYDVAIYVLDQTSPGCPAGTGNAVTNCVTGANAGGPGAQETISHAALAALPVGNYYLFVDSTAVGAASSGSYTLSVGPSICPVELMEFAID